MMKNMGTALLAASLCLLVSSLASAEHRGGGGRAAARPFVTGVKQGFTGAPGAGRAFAAGIGAGYPGAFGYGGFGGYGALGAAGYGFGGWYGYGASESTLLYRLGYLPVPPYYSLHPPVYYGQRIYRTYGDSPYADFPYPRAYRQPAAPQLIQNPLVPVVSIGQSQAPATPTVAQHHGQLIVNPFYDGPAAEQQVAATVTEPAR